MQKEYEVQVKKQIYEFLQEEAGRFINSNEFEKLANHDRGKAIIDSLEIAILKANNKYFDFNEWFKLENIPFITEFEFYMIVRELSQSIIDKILESLEKKQDFSSQEKSETKKLSKDEFVQYVSSIIENEKKALDYPLELYYWSKKILETIIDHQKKTTEEIFIEILNDTAVTFSNDIIYRIKKDLKEDNFFYNKPLLGNSLTVIAAYSDVFKFMKTLKLNNDSLTIINLNSNELTRLRISNY